MAGGLMAIGPGHYERYYGAATYLDKILHGANPADLPIGGPTQFTTSADRRALKNLACHYRTILLPESPNGSTKPVA
jgi:putative ABC transport system substrate-binding protein